MLIVKLRKIKIKHDYCLERLFGYSPNAIFMMQMEKIQTDVLRNMINACSAYYGRELTPGELIDCEITLGILRSEISLREATPMIPLPQPGTINLLFGK